MEICRLRIKQFKLVNMNCQANVISNLAAVMIFAEENNWYCIAFYKKSYHVILVRGKDQLIVYLTTLTVQTAMNHPSKGRTQLTRKNLSFKMLEEVFKHPRVHTGKGYYQKGGKYE